MEDVITIEEDVWATIIEGAYTFVGKVAAKTSHGDTAPQDPIDAEAYSEPRYFNDPDSSDEEETTSEFEQ